jgi:trimeric autotransporter adhesin
MKHLSVVVVAVLLSLSAWAQPASTAVSVSVPPVIQFSGVAADENGSPLSGTVAITFSLYNNSQGGPALWTEMQSVSLDSAGHYSVYLGITQTNGIPTSLFTAGEAHWLGVKVAGQAEQQPRIYLVSVPYAMKAGDAATVGGLPASAFLLAASANAPVSTSNNAAAFSGPAEVSPATSSDVTTSGGTVGAIPMFSASTDIENSVIAQTGTGNSTEVTIATSDAEFGDAFVFGAQGSGLSAAFNMFPMAKSTPFLHMCCNRELNFVNVFVGGAGNLTNEGTDNSVGVGYQALAKIGPGGHSGGIRGNTAVGYQSLAATTTGSENTALGWLSGQGLTTGAANKTGSQNTFIGYASGPGSATQLTNAAAIGANAAVTESNALVLGSINGVNGATANVDVGIGTSNPAATLDVEAPSGATPTINFGSASNPASLTVNGTGTFTGNVTFSSTQTFPSLAVESGSNPTLNIGSSTNAGTLALYGALQIGGSTFDYGSAANGNAYLGFAGNGVLPASATVNTAVGGQALESITSGSANTAIGYETLLADSTGSSNTATGVAALLENNTGSNNTANGFYALISNTGGIANTANGTYALESNSTGNNNTASGYGSLPTTTGSNNTAAGYGAGQTLDGSTITGLNNSFLGSNTALQSGMNNGSPVSNATAIGAYTSVTASNALVLGPITNVNGCTAANSCASINVGIGNAAPPSKLTVSGSETTANGMGAAIQLSNTASGGMDYYFRVGATGTETSAGSLSIANDDEYIMTFTTPGNVGIQTQNPTNIFTIKQGLGAAIADGWTTYSSRRWKINVRPLTDALSKVEQLQGVSYDLKGSDKHEIGVIAEEVGKVVPEVVTYEENGKDARGVDYSRLTALLIEAVKQEHQEISALRTQLRRRAAKEAALELRLQRIEREQGQSQLASVRPVR